MTLQNEIMEKRNEIHTDGYPMSIGEILSIYENEELDIHPEFQRFFRWSPLQKTKLIESILLGIPIPSIFVSQRENGVWDVIDGLQRLSTIFEFVGVLRDENGTYLPPSVLTNTDYLPSLKNKMWNNEDDLDNSLDQSQRIDFKREKLNVQIIKKESDQSIKYELFQRINTLGSKLSDQELRNCILIMINRDFYDWLDDLANYEPFVNCVCLSDKDMIEQYNLELALRFLIFKNIDLNDITSTLYLAQFITDKMMEFSESSSFDKEKEMQVFKDTFDLLDNTLSENSFKRYYSEKGKFQGKFLLSTFETISIGVGSNIDEWNKKKSEIDDLTPLLEEKARSLWDNLTYTSNIGTARNFFTRIPVIVPLGKEIFKP